MRSGMRDLSILLLAGLTGIAGCSDGPRYVKVSGTVTLDGKPYGRAAISFQPIGGVENPFPGVGSSAFTDENGHFELASMDGKQKGAVIGNHRVRIMTRMDKPVNYDPTKGSKDNTRGEKKEAEPIPIDWYGEKSLKEFAVPPAGTDKADFDIVTNKKK